MFTFLKNNLLYRDKYQFDPEAVIISCFFNSQNSPYRLLAFQKFYESIKHLNHRIAECIIGDSDPQLEENSNIKRFYTSDLLWHKESLLNLLVKDPKKYRFVFLVDADVIFTNPNWMTDSVKLLKTNVNILQPFKYCVHLDRDEVQPSFSMRELVMFNPDPIDPNTINPKVWRSFSANYNLNGLWKDEKYNTHGHVGFAWGAKREILDAVPLYDRALIGGADHIIAHAAAGQIPHKCIEKAFTDNMDEINEWSKDFFMMVRGKIGYVEGNLYHIWHGDIDKRQYLKRIKDFTPSSKEIKQKDKNGLYVVPSDNHRKYVDQYFAYREVPPTDDGFLASMAAGYMSDSVGVGTLAGGNLLGAMVGEMLRDDNSNQPKQDYAPDQIQQDYIPSDMDSVQQDIAPSDSIQQDDIQNVSVPYDNSIPTTSSDDSENFS
jgi:hypothetical protein